MEGNRQDSREQGNDLIESSIERRAFSLLLRILFKKKVKEKEKKKKKTTTMMMIGMEEELTTFKRQQKCRLRTLILLTSLYPIKVFLDKSISIFRRKDQRRCLLAIHAIATGIYIYICVEEYTGEIASAVERIHHILRYDFYVIDAATCSAGLFHEEKNAKIDRRVDLAHWESPNRQFSSARDWREPSCYSFLFF